MGILRGDDGMMIKYTAGHLLIGRLVVRSLPFVQDAKVKLLWDASEYEWVCMLDRKNRE